MGWTASAVAAGTIGAGSRLSAPTGWAVNSEVVMVGICGVLGTAPVSCRRTHPSSPHSSGDCAGATGVVPASGSMPKTDNRLVTARATNDGGLTGGGMAIGDSRYTGAGAGEGRAVTRDWLTNGLAGAVGAVTEAAVGSVTALSVVVVTRNVVSVAVVVCCCVLEDCVVDDDLLSGTVCCLACGVGSGVGAGLRVGWVVAVGSVGFSTVAVGEVLVGWEVVCDSVVLPCTTPCALSVDFGSVEDPEPVVTDVVEPVVVWVPEVLVLVVPVVEDVVESESDVVVLPPLEVVVPVDVEPVVEPVVVPVVEPVVVDSPVVVFDPVSVDPLVDEDSDDEDVESEVPVVSAQARP